MSDLKQRLSTGTLFVVVLLSSVLLNEYSYLAIFALITLLGQYEFYKLITKTGASPQILMGVVSGLILFISCFVFVQSSFDNTYILALNFPLIFIVFLIELFRNHKMPFANIAYTLLGIIYIALPFSLTTFLMTNPSMTPTYSFYPQTMAGILFCMWANDSWAYLVGRKFGKTKLYASVSPKKTWEGFIGGIVFCIFFASIISYLVDALSLQQWIIIALILSICGTAGDLVESKLKRSLKIKDSGNILPGHGGILDRFDALILSIPFIIIYLFIRI